MLGSPAGSRRRILCPFWLCCASVSLSALQECRSSLEFASKIVSGPLLHRATFTPQDSVASTVQSRFRNGHLAAQSCTRFFVREYQVLLTTGWNKRSEFMSQLLKEMLTVFPIAIFYERRNYPLKKIVKYATNEGFSDVVVFNEDRKKPNGVMVVHLPEGPTALFKVVKVKLRKDIPNCGKPSTHKPELILNNFNTRLGHRLGRMFASLFDQNPQFRGRQAVTFHNQRDYVFIRHHRYVFEEKQKSKDGREYAKLKARLQELGPRLTLKLTSLQKGTFDSKHGEYEWFFKRDMKTSKRRFFL